MKPLFATEPLERASFVDRPNRFIVRVRRGRRHLMELEIGRASCRERV